MMNRENYTRRQNLNRRNNRQEAYLSENWLSSGNRNQMLLPNTHRKGSPYSYEQAVTKELSNQWSKPIRVIGQGDYFPDRLESDNTKTKKKYLSSYYIDNEIAGPSNQVWLHDSKALKRNKMSDNVTAKINKSFSHHDALVPAKIADKHHFRSCPTKSPAVYYNSNSKRPLRRSPVLSKDDTCLQNKTSHYYGMKSKEDIEVLYNRKKGARNFQGEFFQDMYAQKPKYDISGFETSNRNTNQVQVFCCMNRKQRNVKVQSKNQKKKTCDPSKADHAGQNRVSAKVNSFKVVNFSSSNLDNFAIAKASVPSPRNAKYSRTMKYRSDNETSFHDNNTQVKTKNNLNKIDLIKINRLRENKTKSRRQCDDSIQVKLGEVREKYLKPRHKFINIVQVNSGEVRGNKIKPRQRYVDVVHVKSDEEIKTNTIQRQRSNDVVQTKSNKKRENNIKPRSKTKHQEYRDYETSEYDNNTETETKKYVNKIELLKCDKLGEKKISRQKSDAVVQARSSELTETSIKPQQTQIKYQEYSDSETSERDSDDKVKTKKYVNKIELVKCVNLKDNKIKSRHKSDDIVRARSDIVCDNKTGQRIRNQNNTKIENEKKNKLKHTFCNSFQCKVDKHMNYGKTHWIKKVAHGIVKGLKYCLVGIIGLIWLPCVFCSYLCGMLLERTIKPAKVFSYKHQKNVCCFMKQQRKRANIDDNQELLAKVEQAMKKMKQLRQKIREPTKLCDCKELLPKHQKSVCNKLKQQRKQANRDQKQKLRAEVEQAMKRIQRLTQKIRQPSEELPNKHQEIHLCMMEQKRRQAKRKEKEELLAKVEQAIKRVKLLKQKIRESGSDNTAPLRSVSNRSLEEKSVSFGNVNCGHIPRSTPNIHEQRYSKECCTDHTLKKLPKPRVTKGAKIVPLKGETSDLLNSLRSKSETLTRTNVRSRLEVSKNKQHISPQSTASEKIHLKHSYIDKEANGDSKSVCKAKALKDSRYSKTESSNVLKQQKNTPQPRKKYIERPKPVLRQQVIRNMKTQPKTSEITTRPSKVTKINRAQSKTCKNKKRLLNIMSITPRMFRQTLARNGSKDTRCKNPISPSFSQRMQNTKELLDTEKSINRHYECKKKNYGNFCRNEDKLGKRKEMCNSYQKVKSKCNRNRHESEEKYHRSPEIVLTDIKEYDQSEKRRKRKRFKTGKDNKKREKTRNKKSKAKKGEKRKLRNKKQIQPLRIPELNTAQQTTKQIKMVFDNIEEHCNCINKNLKTVKQMVQSHVGAGNKNKITSTGGKKHKSRATGPSKRFKEKKVSEPQVVEMRVVHVGGKTIPKPCGPKCALKRRTGAGQKVLVCKCVRQALKNEKSWLKNEKTSLKNEKSSLKNEKSSLKTGKRSRQSTDKNSVASRGFKNKWKSIIHGTISFEKMIWGSMGDDFCTKEDQKQKPRKNPPAVSFSSMICSIYRICLHSVLVVLALCIWLPWIVFFAIVIKGMCSCLRR